MWGNQAEYDYEPDWKTYANHTVPVRKVAKGQSVKQTALLCTMIVEEAKKAAKEHNQDFDTTYYTMAHGLWGGDRLVDVDLPDDGILRFQLAFFLNRDSL